jgi:Protein of unknown function (DUF3574)
LIGPVRCRPGGPKAYQTLSFNSERSACMLTKCSLIRAIVTSVITLACGCAHAPPQPACADLALKPMLEYQLFFGRGIMARPELTKQEWSEFTADVITPNLPDGFTAFDADGQWMNPTTRRIAKEKTKVLLVVLPGTEAAATAVGAIRDAYRTQFHQQSVGMTVHPVCGAF